MFSFEFSEDNEDKDDVEWVSLVDIADDLKLDIELNELRDVEMDESTPGLAVDELVVEDEVGDVDEDEEETNDEENMDEEEEDERRFGMFLLVSLIVITVSMFI